MKPWCWTPEFMQIIRSICKCHEKEAGNCKVTPSSKTSSSMEPGAFSDSSLPVRQHDGERGRFSNSCITADGRSNRSPGIAPTSRIYVTSQNDGTPSDNGRSTSEWGSKYQALHTGKVPAVILNPSSADAAIEGPYLANRRESIICNSTLCGHIAEHKCAWCQERYCKGCCHPAIRFCAHESGPICIGCLKDHDEDCEPCVERAHWAAIENSVDEYRAGGGM